MRSWGSLDKSQEPGIHLSVDWLTKVLVPSGCQDLISYVFMHVHKIIFYSYILLRTELIRFSSGSHYKSIFIEF